MIRAESEPLLVGPVKDTRRVCTNTVELAYNSTTVSGSACPTLSDEQALTFEAAMMKSRINMVAPGRPILKNFGLQCFMMVFTMSCTKHTKHILFSLLGCVLFTSNEKLGFGLICFIQM